MHTRFSLKGKRACITGGGAGIGLSLAKAFAEAGADIALADINADKGAEAAENIRKEFGVATMSIPVDVTDPAQAAAMVEECASGLGSLDVFVANAGVALGGVSMLDYTPEQWSRIINVNLTGVFFSDQAAARYMIRQGTGGRIINMCSMSATIINFHAYGSSGAYCSSKGGVKQLTKAFALDLAKYGINVNCISPGYVRTALTASFWEDPENCADKLRGIPLGRPAEPEDLTGLAVYLASDASAYMTGSDVLIDGGFTIT